MQKYTELRLWNPGFAMEHLERMTSYSGSYAAEGITSSSSVGASSSGNTNADAVVGHLIGTGSPGLSGMGGAVPPRVALWAATHETTNGSPSSKGTAVYALGGARLISR
eukprot:367697-Prymnesium_polylepis.1